MKMGSFLPLITLLSAVTSLAQDIKGRRTNYHHLTQATTGGELARQGDSRDRGDCRDSGDSVSLPVYQFISLSVYQGWDHGWISRGQSSADCFVIGLLWEEV